MNSGAGAVDFLEDVGDLCGPDERLGFLIVSVDVVVDGGAMAPAWHQIRRAPLFRTIIRGIGELTRTPLPRLMRTP
jgi:hypothetical protein